MTAGSTTPFVDFSLQRGGRISGTVTTFDERPRSSTPRSAFRSGEQRWRGSADTDAAGAYQANLVPPGTYYLRASRFGYVSTRYEGIPCATSCDPPAGTPVKVAEDQLTAHIDFALRAGGRISGKVTDAATGHPIADVTVSASSASSGASATTGADGTYVVDGLLPGQFRVKTDSWPLDYVDEMYDDIPCPGNSCSYDAGTLVPVTIETTTPAIDFALPRGGRITGTITDQQTGLPIVGSRVRLSNARTAYLQEVETDAAGAVRVHRARGRLVLRAHRQRGGRLPRPDLGRCAVRVRLLRCEGWSTDRGIGGVHHVGHRPRTDAGRPHHRLGQERNHRAPTRRSQDGIVPRRRRVLAFQLHRRRRHIHVQRPHHRIVLRAEQRLGRRIR